MVDAHRRLSWWRGGDTRAHPVLLMVLATTLIVWQDPIMNWAPYAVYNPQLWHWPETWPLVSLSPTVEPFIVIGYVTFYLRPFFPAVWILRRLQARAARRLVRLATPADQLGALILAIGFVFDALLEIILVRTRLYIYSQVIPFGSFFAGERYQFPLIWESLLVTFVMIPAGVLLYRDDTGPHGRREAGPAGALFPTPAGARHVPGDVRRSSTSRTSPTAAGSRSSSATRVRRPRSPARGRTPRRKVYDPQGFYEKSRASRARTPPASGRDGMSAQPDGRPDVEPPADGGRCAPEHDMAEPRSVVITGASRGLGLATAAHLYQQGWRVVAAMRSPGRRTRRAARGDRRPRRRSALDRRPARPRRSRVDRRCRQGDRRDRRRADALVHNAGIAAVGMVEEMPMRRCGSRSSPPISSGRSR